MVPGLVPVNREARSGTIFGTISGIRMEKIEEERKEGDMMVPEDALRKKYVRSSGPGGQKVNKTATKVQLWCKIEKLDLGEDEKQRIREKWSNRINEEDELLVECQEERSQTRNEEIARERLENLIETAIVPQKERVPTKPSLAAKERRLEEKRRKSQKKEMRRKVGY